MEIETSTKTLSAGRLRKLGRALNVGLFLGIFLLFFAVRASAQEGNVSTTETAAKGEPDETIFHLMVRSSGWIGIIILLLSFGLFALVVWMSFAYRRKVALPEDLTRDVTDLLKRKNYTEAYQRLSTDRSFLSRVLAAGVRKLASGLAPAQRAMEMTNDDITMAMEHWTTYLATVGTLGPMIGLVGTVYGMIISFRVMSSAGGSPQASQLAGGISIALFATLEGILLSIPAIAFHAFFRNRISRLSLEVALAAESLLEQFGPGVRPTHPLVVSNPPPPSRTAIPPPKE